MDTLESVIREATNGRSILTVQPGGNHGDTLIYRGFERFLETTDIDHVPLGSTDPRYDAPPPVPSTDLADYAHWLAIQARYLHHRLVGDIGAVYIHGGGNFNDLWKLGIYCYLTAGRYFDCPVVVGPQSVRFETLDPLSVLQSVSNETHFVCREEYSYDVMREAAAHCPHVSVYLDDDTATVLESDDLPVDTLATDYTLFAMRMDRDSAAPMIADDVDGPVLVRDVSLTAPDFSSWVNVTARANRVYTDRLHVAILGIILDKPVVWYDTGYHKNRGVYEYTFAGRDDVDFRYEGAEPSRAPTTPRSRP